MNRHFESTPYCAEGGFSAFGAALLLGICCVTAIVLGVVASIVGQWFYLVLIFPLLIGGGLGLVGGWGVKKGNVRSPALAGVAGLLSGVLSMLALHYSNYLRFCNTIAEVNPIVFQIAENLPEWKANLEKLPPEVQELVHILDQNPEEAALFRVKSFSDYLDAEARQGVSIGRTGRGGGERGMNLGYFGSYIYWMVETLIVAGISFAIMKAAAGEPFCTQCESWKEARYLGGLSSPAEDAIGALHSGDLESLRALGSSTDGGDLLVSVSVCPQCGEKSPIDVKLESVSVNKKGEVSKKQVAHVTYPGETLESLASLFGTESSPAGYVNPEVE